MKKQTCATLQEQEYAEANTTGQEEEPDPLRSFSEAEEAVYPYCFRCGKWLDKNGRCNCE